MLYLSRISLQETSPSFPRTCSSPSRFVAFQGRLIHVALESTPFRFLLTANTHYPASYSFPLRSKNIDSRPFRVPHIPREVYLPVVVPPGLLNLKPCSASTPMKLLPPFISLLLYQEYSIIIDILSTYIPSNPSSSTSCQHYAVLKYHSIHTVLILCSQAKPERDGALIMFGRRKPAPSSQSKLPPPPSLRQLARPPAHSGSTTQTATPPDEHGSEKPPRHRPLNQETTNPPGKLADQEPRVG